MKISILCSSSDHPVFSYLQTWKRQKITYNQVELVNSKRELSGGDILFLISCNEIIGPDIREKYKNTLVIHASDLPRGKGWSPHIWQVLQGRNSITVTLLEAEDVIDSGKIWGQKELKLSGHELYDEINEKLFQIEVDLMDFAYVHFEHIIPRPQKNVSSSYFPKRTPEDSLVDPYKTIAEQFDLMRVADPDRFPNFFDYRGCRYQITLKKIGD